MFGDLEFDLDYSSDTANSDGLVHTVICACGVVGNRDGAEIRSVTVVGGRRLTGARDSPGEGSSHLHGRRRHDHASSVGLRRSGHRDTATAVVAALDLARSQENGKQG
jgi:hypothetical protein